MGGVALTSGPAAILGQYGTLTAAADGTFSYVVNNALPAVEALNVGQALTDTFDYTLSDRFNRTAGARLSITIAGANDAPVAVAITLPPATAGRAFGPITVAPFTDVDSVLLTYSVTGLPAGVVFDPVTRTFSGTPGSVGNFSLTLTASDGEFSVSTTFTLQVTAPPVNTVPSGPIAFTGDPARVVGPDGTVFAVADSDSAELTVTLRAGVGLLTLPNRGGLTLLAGSGLNETSLTFRGLVRDLNAALAQLLPSPHRLFRSGHHHDHCDRRTWKYGCRSDRSAHHRSLGDLGWQGCLRPDCFDQFRGQAIGQRACHAV
jgi:VCBS repeat-containing protein